MTPAGPNPKTFSALNYAGLWNAKSIVSKFKVKYFVVAKSRVILLFVVAVLISGLRR